MLKEEFKFAKQINKPYGGIDSLLVWCKQEIVGEWRWQLIDISTKNHSGEYIFYFDSERDYVAFLMKWSWLLDN